MWSTRKKKPSITCFGSLGKDIFLPTAEVEVIEDQSSRTGKSFQFPGAAKIHIEDRYTALGGGACNVSVALARLGLDVSIMGAVGDDSDGQWINDFLACEGVVTNKLQVIKDARTDLSCIVIDRESGERTIFANRDVGERGDFSQMCVETEWAYVSTFYGDTKVIEKNMQFTHDACNRDGALIAYNPGMLNIRNQSQCVLDIIHHSECLFVNRTEAEQIVLAIDPEYNMYDKDDDVHIAHLVECIRRVSKGVTIVLTDGPKGAWCATQDQMIHVSASETKPRDTTGAGDTFGSGFLAAYIAKRQIDEALLWGAINSASVIRYYGAQEGALTRDAIEDSMSSERNSFTIREI